MNSQAKVNNKKLNAKERYRILTRDLDWDFSYADRKDAFPYEEFEGIKITDWSKWEDPFRLTMDNYWKYQAEKEKKLYAIFDAFAQNNGQMNVSNERYVNAIKLFLTAVTPLEYQAYHTKAMPMLDVSSVALVHVSPRKCNPLMNYVMYKPRFMR